MARTQAKRAKDQARDQNVTSIEAGTLPVGKTESRENSPVLADAEHVLTERLQRQLEGLAVLVEPRLDHLEGRYLRRLEKLGFGPKERRAINLITPGAAIRHLFATNDAGTNDAGKEKPLFAFLEQVEYNGRRLAKLNVNPARVLQALSEYDKLLAAELGKSDPNGVSRSLEGVRYRWVREQLHFCVVVTLNNSYYVVREEETRAQSELFHVEIEARHLRDLLEGSMSVLRRYCRADAGQVFLLDEARDVWRPQLAHRDVAHREVAHRGVLPEPQPSTDLRRRLLSKGFCDVHAEARRQLHTVLDPAWRERYPTVWSVPLIHGRRLAGVMQFGFAKAYEWLPREQDLLYLVAERCLLGAEKVKLMQHLAESENQIRELASRMMQVEEVERRRISRELHDEAGQSMLTIRLQLEMIEGIIPPELPEARKRLAEVREMTEHTILEVRRLIAALSPAVLEQLGLAPGIRQLVARFQRLHPAKVVLDLGRLAGLPSKTEAIVYRLVQECINNIAKHSQARTVNISVHSADGLLQVSVEDDGVGFKVEEALAKRDSFGLAGLRERVALLGGVVRIESQPRGVALVPTVQKPRTRKAKALPAASQKAAAKKKQADRLAGTSIWIELPVPVEVPAATA
jgi:signal transduction histidine kinase